MIDLIAIRDYIKAFAQAHSYIQHNEAVRAYNRFVTYDFDESNTGDTGATAFPRLSLVANSRFGGYNGKMEQQGGQPLKATMQMEVSVVNTYPEGNYRRHDEVSNETLKVLTDLVSYLHANQKAQKCHPVLQHINFNSFQFFKTKLQTHGNAIGWALSFELGARIDSDFSGSIPPPLPMPPTPVGSLFYWNGTQYAPLPPVAAGSVLTSQGLNTPPTWEQGGGNETDPIFTTWLNNVAQVAEWNAAYSWGNHAAAGYALQTDLNNEATARANADNAIILALNDKEDKANKNTGTLTNNLNTYPSEKTVYDAIQAVAPPDPLQTIDIIDDFIGYSSNSTVGTPYWVETALHSIRKAVGTLIGYLGEPNRAGVLNLKTTTNVTETSYIQTSTALHWGSDSSGITLTHIFKLTDNLSTAAKTYNFMAGLSNSTTNSGALASGSGAFIDYTHSRNGGRFRCVAVDAGVSTVEDSGITAALDTWYKLEIHFTPSAIQYKIGGAIVATITTNITANRMAGMFSQQVTTSSWNVCGFTVDFARYQKTLTTSR